MTTADARWMQAALSLARRGRGRTGSNPNVGCLIVKNNKVIGRGWTQDGGRPHAEAMALAEAGSQAAGATAYVTLEPCAHQSLRGPSCADSLIAANLATVVGAMEDPDPRTAGQGFARLRAHGIIVSTGVLQAEAQRELFGFCRRQTGHAPEITLKLALSLDGRLAMADGTSQWITGPVARLYAHVLRAETDMIVAGGGTIRADKPQLTNRLPGSTAPNPMRVALTSREAPDGFVAVASVEALLALAREQSVNRMLVEGGGGVASSLLGADCVDRLILIRAPILIGHGIGLEQFHPETLPGTHGRWILQDQSMLGVDRLEIYRRQR